jgi:GNAT superfamily N-acetyltransferase
MRHRCLERLTLPTILQFRNDVPTADQFWRLFQTTGWNDEYRLAPNELTAALQHSWYVVAVYEGEQLVGFGRMVSDLVMHAMIYDLIVAPGHQQQGIGTQILDRLVKRCREANIRDIQLFCALGKRAFYEKRGFKARPVDAPGMQYRGNVSPL